MKILVTGANGFLGYHLTALLLEKGHTVIATGNGPCRLPFSGENFFYRAMDFTNPFEVHDVFDATKPEAVVHAGAMSKPDDCELNQALAYQVNVEGTVNLLLNAAEQNSHFIFLSTDFVFDGERGMYKEDDVRSPVNYYGRTKAEAEDAVMEYTGAWAIVRTVLVYGKLFGKPNLLTIVKEKLESGEGYKVVNDQFRTPTLVNDLAAGILSVIEKKAAGVFHISGKEMMTPYDMAVQTADFLGLDKSKLTAVNANVFTQPAKRPVKTGFVVDKAENELSYQPHHFLEGLKKSFSPAS